jgi:hypothetical protein
MSSFCCVCVTGMAAGIVKDVTQVDMDKWFGQQAVYRVSMGNFVSQGGRRGLLQGQPKRSLNAGALVLR